VLCVQDGEAGEGLGLEAERGLGGREASPCRFRAPLRHSARGTLRESIGEQKSVAQRRQAQLIAQVGQSWNSLGLEIGALARLKPNTGAGFAATL